jgi:hypothetical protein
MWQGGERPSRDMRRWILPCFSFFFLLFFWPLCRVAMELPPFKTLVIGEAGCGLYGHIRHYLALDIARTGKTSIIRRYVDNTFQQNYSATLGGLALNIDTNSLQIIDSRLFFESSPCRWARSANPGLVCC